MLTYALDRIICTIEFSLDTHFVVWTDNKDEGSKHQNHRGKMCALFYYASGKIQTNSFLGIIFTEVHSPLHKGDI